MLSTIENDAITLHYQPIADRGGAIAGMEALMRWHHHSRGPISPEAFIPIFEKSGLIVPLSRWAVVQACSDAVAWRRPLLTAVNISAIQFDDEDLPRLVRMALGRSGMLPERLELEVTEAALLNDAGGVAATMKRLRKIGVRIALAGAGIGTALPHYLKEFPFSKVKIARSIVANLEGSASARSIAHMIIELGHSMRVDVAAEGVETAGQRAFLEDEECDWLQGFLIGRPAPIEELSACTEEAANDDMPIAEPVRSAGNFAALAAI